MPPVGTLCAGHGGVACDKALTQLKPRTDGKGGAEFISHAQCACQWRVSIYGKDLTTGVVEQSAMSYLAHRTPAHEAVRRLDHATKLEVDMLWNAGASGGFDIQSRECGGQATVRLGLRHDAGECCLSCCSSRARLWLHGAAHSHPGVHCSGAELTGGKQRGMTVGEHERKRAAAAAFPGSSSPTVTGPLAE